MDFKEEQVQEDEPKVAARIKLPNSVNRDYMIKGLYQFGYDPEQHELIFFENFYRMIEHETAN